ncbi:hypothetical protein Tco_0188923 [Tanacetum coccineum]
MRIDELYKFSDGTLNDVRYALDDILKRIWMEYLPQTVWRNVDRERVGAMIQAIDRQLRNKRLMRSLEKFVGGRLYEHVGPEVTSSQDGEVYKMMKGDYAWLMISRSSRSHNYIQVNGTSSSLKSMITTSIHKLKNEVKDYELKTKSIVC